MKGQNTSKASTGKKQKPRITKAEKIKRVDLIFGLLSKGFSRGQILQFVADQEEKGKLAWDVSERSIDRYIEQASALFEEASKVHNDRRFGRALVRLDDLYARSLAINDYKTALSVVRTETDLIGLAPPTRITADVNLSTPDGLLALFREAGKEMEKAWQQEEPGPDDDEEELLALEE